MRKVTYILSLIFKSLEYEWIVRYIDQSQIQLSFILLNPTPSELEDFLLDNKIQTHRVTFKGKLSYLPAIAKTYRLLRQIKPDMVNCNLLDANLIGLTAARFAGVRRRIHTRHHSTFHHVYFPKGKIYDWYSNYLSTEIVAVSSVVENVLTSYEGVPNSKVRIIHHGFGMDDFNSVNEERVNKLRDKYRLDNSRPIVGSISRYIHWKGVQYIIPAFRRILEVHPKAVLLLANARQGANTDQITGLISKLPADSYREIEFESDVLAFYKLLDVFIHVPIDSHSEAFGRIYPECMFSGIPMVCTLSGIANDIVKHDVNALVVPYKDADSISLAVLRILADDELSKRLVDEAKATAALMMSMEKQKYLLEKLYLE